MGSPRNMIVPLRETLREEGSEEGPVRMAPPGPQPQGSGSSVSHQGSSTDPANPGKS